MTAALATLGAAVLSALAAIGRVAIFTAQTVWDTVTPPFYGRAFMQALYQLGYLSLPVIGLAALFTGGALALQIYSGGARFEAEEAVPQIVAIGMVRELGPVLVGLMLVARVTSSIAAEIATMPIRRSRRTQPRRTQTASTATAMGSRPATSMATAMAR